MKGTQMPYLPTSAFVLGASFLGPASPTMDGPETFHRSQLHTICLLFLPTMSTRDHPAPVLRSLILRRIHFFLNVAVFLTLPSDRYSSRNPRNLHPYCCPLVSCLLLSSSQVYVALDRFRVRPYLLHQNGFDHVFLFMARDLKEPCYRRLVSIHR